MSNEKPDLQITAHGKIEKEGIISETKETKIINLNHGLLGKFFGGPESAPTNICGLTLVLLLIIGSILFFVNTKVEPIEYWRSIAVPLMTLIFGYLLSKKSE